MNKKGKRIYIGGAPYTVRTQKKIKGHPGMPPDIVILGQFRPLTHEIICADKLRQSRNLTIVHELVHALEHEYCLGLTEHSVDIISREITGSLGQLGILK